MSLCIYCDEPATIPCPDCGRPAVCDKHMKWYGPNHNAKCSSYACPEVQASPGSAIIEEEV